MLVEVQLHLVKLQPLLLQLGVLHRHNQQQVVYQLLPRLLVQYQAQQLKLDSLITQL
jgi:hypothetical protein